jgi:hypothetical protein
MGSATSSSTHATAPLPQRWPCDHSEVPYVGIPSDPTGQSSYRLFFGILLVLFPDPAIALIAAVMASLLLELLLAFLKEWSVLLIPEFWRIAVIALLEELSLISELSFFWCLRGERETLGLELCGKIEGLGRVVVLPAMNSTSDCPVI